MVFPRMRVKNNWRKGKGRAKEGPGVEDVEELQRLAKDMVSPVTMTCGLCQSR